MERRGLFQYLAPVESNCFQINERIKLGASAAFILCSQEFTFLGITSLSKHIILDLEVLGIKGSITEIVLLGREIVLEEFLCCNSYSKYTEQFAAVFLTVICYIFFFFLLLS